ncbi:MAG: hypothetical protein KGM24_12000, partial [Elusimicrobia bacterium]|nr:hypothetical protein [Elusimicrobiota bacterium]
EVRAARGPNWIAFDDPAGTLAGAPAGAPNADPWRLRGLRVEWNDTRVLFRIFPSRVDASPAAPRPVYDVYIDLNHVTGAGKIGLLDGRGVFAQARDAWEYALTVVGSNAHLYRASLDQEPDEIGAYKAELDAAAAEIRVEIPRETLRGDPALWGYLLLALAEDPAHLGRDPADILVGPDGARVLGLLAPLDVQHAVIDHPGVPHRVSAARLVSGPRL